MDSPFPPAPRRGFSTGDFPMPDSLIAGPLPAPGPVPFNGPFHAQFYVILTHEVRARTLAKSALTPEDLFQIALLLSKRADPQDGIGRV